MPQIQISTPFGPFYAKFSQDGLVALSFEALGASPAGAAKWFPQLEAELAAYFTAGASTFTIPLDLGGLSPFCQRVLTTTRTIPWGETRTYAWLAQKIGQPQAYRAVGMALKANPLPIIIPCHRVIRSDGHIGGYGGKDPSKIAIKAALLALEGVLPPG